MGRPLTLPPLWIKALAAFSEGGILLYLEISASIYISPLFGNSLFTWGAILGTTLLAMVTGYFLASRICSRYTSVDFLLSPAFWILAISMTCQIILFHQLHHVWLSLPYFTGLLLFTLLLLFVPVLMCSFINTLLIQSVSIHFQQAGKASAYILAISTLGGIMSAFGNAFYAIPYLGLTTSQSIAIGIAGINALIRWRKKHLLFLLSTAGIFFYTSRFYFPPASPYIRILYHHTGIRGEILVADHAFYSDHLKEEIPVRTLFINRMGQSMINLNTDNSPWIYTTIIQQYLTQTAQHRKKCLLLGLGAGSLAHDITKQSFDLEIVEIDPRLPPLTLRYFFPHPFRIIHDDARHFLNITTQKYDLIISDVFSGENPLPHLYSIEFFNSLQKNLSDSGVFIMNYFGFYKGDKGLSSRCIYYTLKKAGYNVTALLAGTHEHNANLLFFVTKKDIPISLRFDKATSINMEKFYTGKEFVITDHDTRFLYATLSPSLEWRKGWRNFFKNLGY